MAEIKVDQAAAECCVLGFGGTSYTSPHIAFLLQVAAQIEKRPKVQASPTKSKSKNQPHLHESPDTPPARQSQITGIGAN